jgi:hypothetical protein
MAALNQRPKHPNVAVINYSNEESGDSIYEMNDSNSEFHFQ